MQTYMKTKEISIIVPIYNAEKFLPEAIESLINQTFKDIEIILVNDGSPDGSQKICEKYAKKDERIIIVNKENGGLADARNAGMKVATGKYIMFLDADDMFEPDSCENMYKAIEENKADYVIGNYQMIEEDGTRWNNTAFDMNKYQDFKLDKNDFKKSFFVMNSTAWNKIYRAEFLEEHDITFKVPSPSEDDYFTSLCYIKSNNGFFMHKVMYLYRNCQGSISKSCSLKYFKGINYAYTNIYKSFKDNNEINYYRYVYAKKNAYLLCQLIDSVQVSDEEKISCLKDFEWYFDLSKKLKIDTVHETLREVMHFVREKNYQKAIVEMNRLKEYRATLPDNIKKQMSFPTPENYAQMEKHNYEFINK